MKLKPHQLGELEELLGSSLTPELLAHYNLNHDADVGYFEMDDRPRSGRKLLLLYTGCWGRGLKHYLVNHRPELYAEYSPLIILDYALVIQVLWQHRMPTAPIVEAAWKSADAIIFSPIGSIYGEFGSEHLLKFVKASAKTASFTGPSQGCWWPVCPVVGEHGVYALMAQGLSDAEIFERFTKKTFDPKFHDRFIEQRAFLKGKQSFGSVRLAEFIDRYYKSHKLFFTYNHPTYHILAFCCDCCFELFGHKSMGDDHALAIPHDSQIIGGIFPETDYEFEHYKFTYPIRYPMNLGGPEFYRSAIADARKRFSVPQP